MKLFRWLLSFAVFYIDAPAAGGTPPSSPEPPAGASPPTPSVSSDGGVTVPIPMNMSDSSSKPPTPPATPPAINLKELIPEEFRGKAYMKEILEKNDLLGLVKKLDGAQRLIGTAPHVPVASVEEAGAIIKELKLEGANEEAIKGFQDMFHKLKLSKEQISGVIKGLQAYGTKEMEASIAAETAAEEKLNAEFEDLSAKTFGDRQDVVLETTRKFIAKYAPAGFKEKLKEAPNEVLITMASVIDGIVKDYVNEDDIAGLSTSTKPTALTKQAAYDEMVKLYADPAAKNAFDPRHNEVMARMKELSKLV